MNSMSASVYLLITFLRKPIYIYISFIHENIFNIFAGNVYGCENISVQNFSLMAKKDFNLVSKQNGHYVTCFMSNGVILFKERNISLSIAPRGLECENNLQKVMA